MATTTFNFDDNTEKAITRLKEAFGATTKSEVLRLAIGLLDLARQAKEKNQRVAVVDENDGIQPILIPGYSSATN